MSCPGGGRLPGIRSLKWLAGGLSSVPSGVMSPDDVMEIFTR